MRNTRKALPLLLGSALLLSACGDSSGDDTAATVAPANAESTAAAALPTPTLAQPPTESPAQPTDTVTPRATRPSLSALIPDETATPESTPTAEATPTPDPAQTQQFSWSGGYSFWPPAGYEIGINGGQTLFTSPAGVMALAGGPEQNSSRPPEQAMAEALAAINGSMGAALQTGAPFPVTVGGKTVTPTKGGWKTNREGMARLVNAGVNAPAFVAWLRLYAFFIFMR